MSALLDRVERQIAADLGITVEQWRERADELGYVGWTDRPAGAEVSRAVARCWRCGRFAETDAVVLRWVQTGVVDGGRPLLSVGSFCDACEAGS